MADKVMVDNQAIKKRRSFREWKEDTARRLDIWSRKTSKKKILVK